MLSPGDVNSSEIEGWGSGFFLKYKGILYFVTCDHNVHLLDDFENGERCGEDYNIAVIANVKGKDEPLSSGFLTLPSFVYYDKYDIDLPEAKELIDVAFTEVKEPIPIPLLTNMLCDIDGNILVNHGEEKLILSDAAIDYARADDSYIVTGCIRNKISNSVRMDRCTTFRNDIKFTGRKELGCLIFSVPYTVIYEDWIGLSGSPVFSEEGHIVGMLKEVNDLNNTLHIVAMEDILKFIDYYVYHKDVINSL